MTDSACSHLMHTITYLPDNLPDWASPGNWLGLEGHADFKNPVDDPSLCNLCSFPLKLFKDETEIMSSLVDSPVRKEMLSEIRHNTFLCNFRECPLVLLL